MGISDRVMGAEGKWLMGSFLPRELRAHIEDHLAVVAPGRERELRDAIKARVDELVDANADLITDGPSEGMLGLSAVVLAAYQVLRPEIGDDQRTILLLRHVFLEVLRQSMDFEFDQPDDDTFEMRVTGCFFERFFSRHDAREVTTVLCAWDANWMRALDPAVMGVTAERTSLLSLGGEACRFRVLRTDDPLATYRDVLDDAPESAPGS